MLLDFFMMHSIFGFPAVTYLLSAVRALLPKAVFSWSSMVLLSMALKRCLSKFYSMPIVHNVGIHKLRQVLCLYNKLDASSQNNCLP